MCSGAFNLPAADPKPNLCPFLCPMISYPPTNMVILYPPKSTTPLPAV